ncbi:MAG: hypothetical protein H7210_08325 [Pyrinomonadaceae bacterium]|nr:hypothetical protein [Phycisphaerales bacterium]
MIAANRVLRVGHLTKALAGIAASVLIIGSASAQQIPAAETGPQVIRATRVGNQFELIDVATNFPVMGLGYPFSELMGAGIETTVDFRPQPTGADIAYTLVNNGTVPARMGRFTFGKIDLGPNISYPNFVRIGETKTADINNYAYQGLMYPLGVYSPAWVLQNEQYSVGISIQYPILDYKHDVRVMLGSTSATADPAVYGRRGWFVEFRFSDLGEGRPFPNPGYMAPGERRTYVVSLRITKNPADWIRTLVPYRNYFRSMYGGVSYRRDPRPIRPVLMALEHLISPNNPNGWNGFSRERPDLYSFRPWVDNIKNNPNYERTMLWAPTGLYDERRDLNYPFQFTSRWLDDPQLASALDQENGFPSVARAGKTLGLWWGRAVQVSRTWNPTGMENFDFNNRDHREMAFREMDVAVQAGATDIGLDTFTPSVSPIWHLYPWIRMLRERYPTIKFCTEPLSCDILHTQAAVFAFGWSLDMPRDGGPNWNTFTNPYYLADFLNPGHETWGAMSYHVHRGLGIVIPPTQGQRDIELIASKGFVPIMMDGVAQPQNIFAAESWTQSVPLDLQRGAGWNTNFTPNMVVRGSDGKMVIVAGSDVPVRPGDLSEPGELPSPTVDGAVPTDAPVAADAGDPVVEGSSKYATFGDDDGNSGVPTPKAKPGSKAVKAAATQNKRLKMAPPSSSRPQASTGKAGSAVSSAALARAGLLGKSSGTFNKNQILRALQRMNEPASPDAK